MSSVLTAKRPVGILRYNAEVMRNNGAPQEVIEKYLVDNGADINLIMAVPTPNQNEINRMLASESAGSFAAGKEKAQEAHDRATASQERLDRLKAGQGAVRAFGNGLFLNWGDELENKMTGQPVEEIRQEQSDWSRRNPTLDLALGIAGGMAPLVATGGGGALATGGAAGKSVLTRAGLGALYGAGTGAVAGAGAGEDTLENRLENAGYGSLFGAGIGGAMPVAIGGVGRATGRIARGLGKGPSEKEVGDFVLNNIVAGAGKPGARAQNDASVLFQAIQDKDASIQNAARNLQNKMAAMGRQRNPEIVELAVNPNWSPETPSAQSIMRALTTDSKRTASEKFGEFVANQPEKTGAGLALNEYFKRNPVAAKIVSANQRRIGTDLTTYGGLQKIEDTLNRNLPKNLDNARVVNRNAQILDAIEDLSNLRETLFPGQKVMDAMYRASVGGVDDVAQDTARSYVQQLASGIANPTNLEVSLTGASKLGLKPYVRGRARELILKGSLEPDTSSTLENILQRAGFGTHRTLEEQQ